MPREKQTNVKMTLRGQEAIDAYADEAFEGNRSMAVRSLLSIGLQHRHCGLVPPTKEGK